MNNNTSIENQISQMYFDYKPEQNAIYVSPNISDNYGYILPMSCKTLNSNTYTFIYKENPNCKIFIAPISLRKNFSKVFLSHKKYDKKLYKYLKIKCSKTNPLERPVLVRKPHVYEELDGQSKIIKKINGLNEIMKIFDMSHCEHDDGSNIDSENDQFVSGFSEGQHFSHNIFTPPELLDNSVFCFFSEDIAGEDNAFDD